MAMLDAVRQASSILGAHPESFHNYSLDGNKLTFRAKRDGPSVADHPGGVDDSGKLTGVVKAHIGGILQSVSDKVDPRGPRLVDNEFDLSDDGSAIYRSVDEKLVDKVSGKEYSVGSFSPEAQRRVHGRDLLWRDNKWVPTPLERD